SYERAHLCVFSLLCYRNLPHLPSLPTRRSSDLSCTSGSNTAPSACECASTNPGITRRPSASSTRASRARPGSMRPTAVIRSPSTSTSARTAPPGVTTWPPGSAPPASNCPPACSEERLDGLVHRGGGGVEHGDQPPLVEGGAGM